MAKPAHFSTKDRILGAAEELFAQHGFAGTSLRQVTSQADVNIAAVNYHFGSKENLVNEVFRRRMDEMTGARLAQLSAPAANTPGSCARCWPPSSSRPWRWPRTARTAAPSCA
jgi:AcrR family transcriptional regulator